MTTSPTSGVIVLLRRRRQKTLATGITDWRGVPVEIGSVVVYPTRRGSNTYVVEAEVVDVSERFVDVARYYEKANYSDQRKAVKPRVVTVPLTLVTVVRDVR